MLTGYTAFGLSTFIDIFGNYKMLIRCLNVATNLGVDQTVTGCELKMYPYTKYVNGYYTAHRLLHPWVEGLGTNTVLGGGDAGCNYLRWNHADSYEWTDAGAACANDDGTDNTADDQACNQSYRRDRHATALATVNVTAANQWWTWDLGAAYGDALYDGTAEENGQLITADGSADYNFPTDDYTADTSKRPYYTFTHEATGGGAAAQMIIISE